ncbi:tRNA guanosine(15) transglycosylase TgtA [Candidatus Bathyarchaeota archaeon]|jgi:7-cyano-7-deazaguanine tRNA-ribosyltransferase|nr:tRNA guanosine(15) transglycosylase TgtA [Candidatus Bathyarchaeota archaeon]MBT4319914.1 tRNA guanosine(15) transglycosylase TgtA [Candidatus Bathyarchaeota archaeon]MBT4422836.1 tRNA guanosine(15) transglycosylase TgtA [Candidatus Bathyarchaeota archaeon]MBT6605751.1 tRNA guanosine(15) transglycosylase TgtA [Candidatus Bathyarchaeota archaeon]MBT7186092.1 tRNA guanosine(15) transglycosylase TgtA [Candidatus Bathyarchaeota archaeon]
MSFELRDRDLLGRIGKLTVRGKTLETPAFMPVVNPMIQTISPRRLKKEFGCDIIITNSYIIRNHFLEIPNVELHKLLDYDGIIMTDSGAYQILVYGEVEVTQPQIIDWQKKIGSDISVILDIPTGWDIPREKVEYTVEKTLERAREALPLIEGSNNLWVGPIQGGKYLDLVEKSAKAVGMMPFDLHALGSPTEVMERYMYPVLVDMAMTAKIHAPVERPIHLFGAGHPNMFAMSVAMGYDLFDSAAYALFAKDERYLTVRGTLQFKDLKYLPCSCPVCRNKSPEDLAALPRGDRIRIIAEHNMHVTMTEMETIKQAIVEGNLWDLVETRAKGHSQMTAALKRLSRYDKYLEEGSDGFKGRGLFYYDYHSIHKPEVLRHQEQLMGSYRRPTDKSILVLMSEPTNRPFNGNAGFKKLKKSVDDDRVHYCFVAAPYGVVPANLAETYPLSQFEIARPLDHETIQSTADYVRQYVEKYPHEHIVLVLKDKPLEESLLDKLSELVKPNNIIHSEALGDGDTLEILSKLIQSLV